MDQSRSVVISCAIWCQKSSFTNITPSTYVGGSCDFIWVPYWCTTLDCFFCKLCNDHTGRQGDALLGANVSGRFGATLTADGPDNIAEAGRLRLPGGTYGSLRQSIAAAHSEAGRRRLCQIKNAHATAWWREADAGWLPACRCRPGAGSTGCAGLNAAHGVTTGCQRRPASGCADVDRDWDDRAVYSGKHALPATDVTIGTADPGLSEWRKVTCGAFSGFPTNFGSLSHQLSPSCREPSLTCTAQLTGIGGSSFLSRKCASSSVFIFVYTIHRWVKSTLITGCQWVRIDASYRYTGHG